MSIIYDNYYLRRIVEYDDLYAERRNTFLNYLLTRFVEQFTDLALLSYGQQSRQQASSAMIEAKENFWLPNHEKCMGYNYVRMTGIRFVLVLNIRISRRLKR